ncbi:hypothetical protein QFZ51_005074 [Chitinophaga sp. W3I9]
MAKNDKNTLVYKKQNEQFAAGRKNVLPTLI